MRREEDRVTLPAVILAVDPGHAGERHEARVCALLWSGDADPRLLASENFRSIQDFKAWLIRQRMQWLDAPITVQWSERLIGSPSLVTAITEVLLDQRPPDSTSPPAAPSVVRRPL